MARKPSSGAKTSSGQTSSGNKTSLADQAAALEAMFDEARRTDSRMITVRGAREHNLKNVDLAIPRDKLVVFTGLSGSANPRSPSTRSMRKASAAMSRASRPMPASSWR